MPQFSLADNRNVPLAGLGGAQYESSRSDTFLDKLRAENHFGFQPSSYL